MKNPFKKWLLGLISLLSVLVITGCAYVPVTGIILEKNETRVTRTYKPYTKKHCYQLKILDAQNVEHKRCVSERVWEDAMFDHEITLTEEYH